MTKRRFLYPMQPARGAFGFWLIAAVSMLFAVPLRSQEINMHTSGHRDTTISYVKLYDDGGPSAPHSTVCNATYTFHTTNTSSKYRVVIHNDLTHPQGNACLSIYSGPTATGSPICSFYSGGNGQDYLFYSYWGTVTVKFTADDDYPNQGFEVELCEVNNYVPNSVLFGWVDSSTAWLSWNESNPSTIWTVTYAFSPIYVNASIFLADTTNVTATVEIDTNYIEIPNVPPGYYVIYAIYPRVTSGCHNMVFGVGAPPSSEPPPCPCTVPVGMTASRSGDYAVVSWNPNPAVTMWHLWSSSLGLDTVLAGSVTSFSIPYDFPCLGGDWVSLNGNCLPGQPCNQVSVGLPAGGCQLTTGTISRLSTTGSSITLMWPSVNSTARYLLYYRPFSAANAPYTLWDTIPSGTSNRTVTVTGLSPHTEYEFQVVVMCGGNDPSCLNTYASFITTLDNCIDFINVYDLSKVHLTWGSYTNPMENSSMNGYGSNNNIYFTGSMRHLPILDSSARDYNTGLALRCVPPGEEVSIRLGDEDVGAKGETITYDYHVDTNQNDMLLLRYAVVMQNPNHTAANQPHFTMEILDTYGHIIDTTCCYADFFAAGDSTWNSVPGSNVVWKDWSTIGIDVTRFHGQMIKIRFTTKDCADGGHYGYAYFNIRCDNKRICIENLCDAIDSVHLRAPTGFEYLWMRDGDSTVISRNNDIRVPADGSSYHCLASFIGKPDCNFTVTAQAVNVFPSASMEYTIDTCRQVVHLHSTSQVVVQGGQETCAAQHIDSVRWDVDGAIYNGADVTVPLTENRTYHVSMRCMLSGSQCADSVTDSFSVAFVHLFNVMGDSVACIGDTVQLAAHVTPFDDVSLLWDDGSSDTLRSVVVWGDTVPYVTVSYGQCLHTLRHHIKGALLYDDTIVANICGGTYHLHGFNEDTTGIYTQNLVSRYGCDSLSTLNLTLRPSYFDTLRVATCDVGYYNYGFLADSSGSYVQQLASQYGCDSIHVLELVRQTISIVGPSDLCEGDTVALSVSGPVGAAASYLWCNGDTTPTTLLQPPPPVSYCDVTVTVNDTCSYSASHTFIVHYSYNDTIVGHICSGYYDTLGFHENQTGLYTLFLNDRYGCDSLSTLDLTLHPSFYDTLRVATCNQPYSDDNFNVSESGFYTRSYATVWGCDSIISLVFTRHPVFLDTIDEEILSGDTYFAYGFRQSVEGEYDTVYVDRNGCDSTYHLNLKVVELMFPNAVTPNGDGINERLGVVGLLGTTLFDYTVMWVYDRWGRLIFKKENFQTEADFWSPAETGSPDGTYYYRFFGRSLSHEILHKGVVEVLR